MDKKQPFDLYRYVKILVLLLVLSFVAVVVSYVTLETAHAAEIEPEQSLESETEAETIYSDGNYALTSDGNIISVQEAVNESENVVSDTGNNDETDVSLEQTESDPVESLPGGTVSEGSQQTEISDSTVHISDSTVIIQPLADPLDEGMVYALGGFDSVSVPTDRCVTYEVEFDGTAYTAVFPLSVADSITVSDGILLNVGASAITGRLFQNSFDTSTYGQWFVTLNSVVSTSGNNNAYRYGAWSYLTTYTPNTGSMQTNLSSDTTYGNFYVIEEPAGFSGLDSFESVCIAYMVLSISLFIITFVRKERRY